MKHAYVKLRPEFQAMAVLLTVLGVTSGSVLLGQSTNVRQSPDMTLELPAGRIVEWITVTDRRDVLYAWEATRGEEFVEAAQDRLFRLRPTLTGEYTVRAAAALPSQVQQVRKTFRLTVLERQEQIDEDGAPFADDEIVRTKPVLGTTSTVLPQGVDTIVVYPNPNLGEIAIDTNTLVDTDSDGITDNDNDAVGTLFATEKQPLHIWFAAYGMRRMRVWSGDRMQEFDLRSGPAQVAASVTSEGASSTIASSRSSVSSRPAVGPFPPNTVSARLLDRSRVQFAYPLPDEDRKRIISHWNFGDGSQSLETEPIHTYVASGSYRVGVSVRELTTGRIIRSGDTTVEVAGPERASSSEQATSASSAASSDESSSSAEQSSASGSAQGSVLVARFTDALRRLGSLWPIIGLGLLTLLVTVIIIVAIRRLLKMGSGFVRNRIASAESKLMDRPELAETDMNTPAPPMELKRSREANPVIDVTPAVEEATTPDTPAVETNVVPPWLAGGSTASTTQTAPTESGAGPVPPWMSGAASADTSPGPNLDDGAVPPWMNTVPPAAESAAPAAASATESVPPWLQPVDTPQTETPTSGNDPAATPPWLSPSPNPTEATTSSSPAVPTDNVPPWLQPTPSNPESSASPEPATPAGEPSSTTVADPMLPPSLEPSIEPANETSVETPASSPSSDPIPTPEATATAPQEAPAAQETTDASLVSSVVEVAAPAAEAAPPVAAAEPEPQPTTNAATADPAAPKALSPEQIEREKERKRLKRLRYRENQKKRREQAKTSTAPGETETLFQTADADTAAIDAPASAAEPVPEAAIEALPTAATAAIEPNMPEVPATDASPPPSAPAKPATETEIPDSAVAFVVRAESVSNSPPSPADEKSSTQP